MKEALISKLKRTALVQHLTRLFNLGSWGSFNWDSKDWG